MIPKAERQDVPLLLEFIRDIARFGRMEDEVIASPEVLEREMFDEHRAEAVFAVVDSPRSPLRTDGMDESRLEQNCQ